MALFYVLAGIAVAPGTFISSTSSSEPKAVRVRRRLVSLAYLYFAALLLLGAFAYDLTPSRALRAAFATGPLLLLIVLNVSFWFQMARRRAGRRSPDRHEHPGAPPR
jgi:hypothetical protein